MRQPADDLIREIERVFPERVLPQVGITTLEAIPDGEDQEISERLRGRTWKELSQEEILETPACFLTADAIAALIPAFMVDRLRSGDDFYRVEEMQLLPSSAQDHRSDELAARLTGDQGTAIEHFLRFAASQSDPEAVIALPIWTARIKTQK